MSFAPHGGVRSAAWDSLLGLELEVDLPPLRLAVLIEHAMKLLVVNLQVMLTFSLTAANQSPLPK
jgi:hypothetical protein